VACGHVYQLSVMRRRTIRPADSAHLRRSMRTRMLLCGMRRRTTRHTCPHATTQVCAICGMRRRTTRHTCRDPSLSRALSLARSLSRARALSLSHARTHAQVPLLPSLHLHGLLPYSLCLCLFLSLTRIASCRTLSLSSLSLALALTLTHTHTRARTHTYTYPHCLLPYY
jgi:hypothetical protein